jgi:hypothetical protein
MSKWIYLLMLWLVAPLFAQEPSAETGGIRFRAMDIFVDSGSNALAAYQLVFLATNGVAKITGIEGGDHPVFKDPPHYDPKAMQHDRVVIAAFSTETAAHLPVGKTRVATIHFAISGGVEPKFMLRLVTTAGPDGTPTAAVATFETRPQK